jgi:hypothetical protein
MKLARLFTAACAAIALVGTTLACIEAMDLNKMVSKTDVAVRGTITQVRSDRSFMDGSDWPRIFTYLTIEGEDLYTGKQTSVEMAFMGGTYEGVTEVCSTMPAVADYRMGNKVVAFSSTTQGWGEVDRVLYAGYGGIYREVDTGKGAVILGRGKDFAIESNITINDLKAGVAKAIEAKQQEVK